MPGLADATGETACLPCLRPLKSGAKPKLFRRGARLRPRPFGAPLRGRAEPRPTAGLRLHAVLELAFQAASPHPVRTTSNTKTNTPPASSQCCTGYWLAGKINSHEQKHYDDFALSSSPITLGEEYFSDSSIWARMVAKGITLKETTPCTSEDEFYAKIGECLREEGNALEPISEGRAYGVSDTMWPQYYYQNGQGHLDGNIFQ